MGSLEVNEGLFFFYPTSMPVNPIIRMNLNSSQTKPVQSWGLGHFGLEVLGKFPSSQ